MRKMAEETGGRVIDVGNNGRKMEDAFAQIEEELRTQYVASYTPTNDKLDGSYRKIDIECKGDGLKVQSRKRVRQLVHHVADSHMNAYIRVRLGLTEDWPTIVPYQEARWADLEDARAAPVSSSLDLLQALHARWVRLFAPLEEQDWKRGYVHPENGRESIEQAAMLYDWHGRHHTAHVTQLRARMGW